MDYRYSAMDRIVLTNTGRTSRVTLNTEGAFRGLPRRPDHGNRAYWTTFVSQYITFQHVLPKSARHVRNSAHLSLQAYIRLM